MRYSFGQCRISNFFQNKQKKKKKNIKKNKNKKNNNIKLFFLTQVDRLNKPKTYFCAMIILFVLCPGTPHSIGIAGMNLQALPWKFFIYFDILYLFHCSLSLENKWLTRRQSWVEKKPRNLTRRSAKPRKWSFLPIWRKLMCPGKSPCRCTKSTYPSMKIVFNVSSPVHCGKLRKGSRLGLDGRVQTNFLKSNWHCRIQKRKFQTKKK